MPFYWSWPGGWKKGDNRIKGHWFWNGKLRHLLHTSTQVSNRACLFFLWQKTIAFECSLNLHFYALIIGFFRSVYLQFRMVTPRLVSIVDYCFDQWSIVRFVIKKLFCVIVYGETVYIFSYTDVFYGNIFLPFMIWE